MDRATELHNYIKINAECLLKVIQLKLAHSATYIMYIILNVSASAKCVCFLSKIYIT